MMGIIVPPGYADLSRARGRRASPDITLSAREPVRSSHLTDGDRCVAGHGPRGAHQRERDRRVAVDRALQRPSRLARDTCGARGLLRPHSKTRPRTERRSTSLTLPHPGAIIRSMALTEAATPARARATRPGFLPARPAYGQKEWTAPPSPAIIYKRLVYLIARLGVQ